MNAQCFSFSVYVEGQMSHGDTRQPRAFQSQMHILSLTAAPSSLSETGVISLPSNTGPFYRAHTCFLPRRPAPPPSSHGMCFVAVFFQWICPKACVCSSAQCFHLVYTDPFPTVRCTYRVLRSYLQYTFEYLLYIAIHYLLFHTTLISVIPCTAPLHCLLSCTMMRDQWYLVIHGYVDHMARKIVRRSLKSWLATHLPAR